MKNKPIFSILIAASIIILSTSLTDCDRGDTPKHPCNFPDVETANNLLVPWSYKIIDKTTSVNLVDNKTNSTIHVDSVVLFDDNFEIIPSSYRYWIDNWIFENLTPYKGMAVPANDPKAYLDLKERYFFLRTSFNDIDTIKITFESCLVKTVLFNGRSTLQPANHQYDGGCSFYFKK